MSIQNIFGHNIIRLQCTDESLYRNVDLVKSVNSVFNLPKVKNRIRFDKNDSHKGAGYTTVDQEYMDLVHLPGSHDLVQWVTKQLIMVHKELGIDKEVKSVYYKRSWANRLLRGGHGLCHCHVKLDRYMEEMTNHVAKGFRPDAVAIFYVDVPEGSSDLVIVNNGAADTYLEDYEESDKYHLKPKEGEMIIHPPDVWHAVSVHNSDLPRNVFVFDIDYV